MTLTGQGKDPDQDHLNYKWWRYFEANTYQEYHGNFKPISDKEKKLSLHRDLDKGEVVDPVKLTGADTEKLSFTIPKDARNEVRSI
ncbi:Uncharacterised protein [Streptococcus pneumoniae]|nr:Uncharacterised protein [Streptococcus pneumoniae]VNW87664.1 Uncharacterised protein [Streptococcus pneumoniae]